MNQKDKKKIFQLKLAINNIIQEIRKNAGATIDEYEFGYYQGCIDGYTTSLNLIGGLFDE